MKISQTLCRPFLYGISVCLLLIAASFTTFAQPRSTISGYVFGPGRIPVSQVAVELRNDFDSVIGRTRTGASGQFTFLGVPSGRFTVTVLPLGTNFEEQSKGVEIAGIGARGQLIPENVQIDFYLQPRKEQEPTSAGQVVFVQEVPEPARKNYESAISDLGSKRAISGRREAFSLVFSGNHSSPLKQETYLIEHEKLGAFSMLVVPIFARDKTVRYYEINVNRLHG